MTRGIECHYKYGIRGREPRATLTVTDAIHHEAEKVTISRLWSHTVGIVNQKRRVVMLGGRKIAEELPGTASAILWGQHHCILTAKHVIENADKGDFRFSFRSTGTVEHMSDGDQRIDGVKHDRGRPVEIYNIFRCDWEDLAVLTVNPHAEYLSAEFFDFRSAWGDPVEGTRVCTAGFPTHKPLTLSVPQSGTEQESIFGLVLTLWDSSVIAKPSSLVDSYSTEIPFDPERHFLAKWAPADPTMGMRGFSGSASWIPQPIAETEIWSLKLVFGGVCTYYCGEND